MLGRGKGRMPAVQAPNLGDKSKEITFEANELTCCMASGKGRTPAVTDLGKARTPAATDRRQMNTVTDLGDK